MAEKKRKSQAEKAASTKKTPAKKASNKQGSTEKDAPKERVVPTRFITSVVFLGLFVLFLITYLSSEGVLNELFEGIILGLFGWVGYIVSIPALLYLFVIHAFSNKRPVVMRSVCVGTFVLLCGCVAHLAQNAVQSIQIGATGTKIQTCALKGIKAVCCALFGPIGSLLLLLLSQQFPRLAVCALTQATFNLLPVYPLDGGRALLGCLEILFSEEWADKLFRILECIILCLLCVLLSSICNLHYGLFCGLLNW